MIFMQQLLSEVIGEKVIQTPRFHLVLQWLKFELKFEEKMALRCLIIQSIFTQNFVALGSMQCFVDRQNTHTQVFLLLELKISIDLFECMIVHLKHNT